MAAYDAHRKQACIKVWVLMYYLTLPNPIWVQYYLRNLHTNNKIDSLYLLSVKTPVPTKIKPETRRSISKFHVNHVIKWPQFSHNLPQNCLFEAITKIVWRKRIGRIRTIFKYSFLEYILKWHIKLMILTYLTYYQITYYQIESLNKVE